MAMVVVFGFFVSGGYILLPAVLFSALLVPHASLLLFSSSLFFLSQAWDLWERPALSPSNKRFFDYIKGKIIFVLRLCVMFCLSPAIIGWVFT